MAGADLAIRLLGPVELWRDGAAVPAGGPTQRAVLAMLAMRADQPVSAAALSDGVWGEADEPAGAAKAMQVHVARLRKVLRSGKRQPLQSVPGGYRLDGDRLAVDAAAFERGVADGRRLLADGQLAPALEQLDAALGLWRGPALMDLRDFPFAAHAADRYEELRVDAAEQAIAARLALGQAQALVPPLQALIAEHPYRERLHGQLMTALYRAGQQAAALDAYTAARSRLVLDLAIEPGPELQALQQRILAQDPELAVRAAPTTQTATRPAALGRSAPRPPPAPILFGREALLAELEAMAPAERLITLTGAGGSGKTVLALALAHRLAPRYPGGVFFVDLAAVSRPEHVLPAVAADLGITPQAGDLAEQLANSLTQRPSLVVLDNLEHVLDAVPVLAPLVAATSGLIIATSRAPLGLQAERLVPVPPLPVPDPDEHDLGVEPAVALFRRSAGNAGTELEYDELPTVAAICRAVDGLPLAIELVAAQTRAESVSELAADLDRRLPAMPAAVRDVPERQRTMEAAIGWSLVRLPAEEQRAFHRLAVFAGGFDARAASAVLGAERPAAIKLLSALLDASLLVRAGSAAGQARFRMLEPLRAVATATAEPTERTTAAERHAALVVAEVERLCPAATGIQTPENLAQLRLQHPDLMAAVALLAETEPNRGVDVLVQLEEYWIWTGRVIDTLDLADRLLAASTLSARGRCGALLTRSTALGSLFDHRTEAREAIEQAVALTEHFDDPAMSAGVRRQQADILLGAGDVEGMRAAARSALAHARRARNTRLIGRMTALRVYLDHYPGPWIPAPRERERVEDALSMAHAARAVYAEVTLLLMLGLLLGSDPLAARTVLQSALNLVRPFDAPSVAALIENNLAMTTLQIGDVDESRVLLLRATRAWDRTGAYLPPLVGLRGLAETEIRADSWRNGLILFGACDALAAAEKASGFRTLETTEHDAIQTAEQHLGAAAAAEARAIGEQMTYREAVDFAFEISGVTPP